MKNLGQFYLRYLPGVRGDSPALGARPSAGGAEPVEVFRDGPALVHQREGARGEPLARPVLDVRDEVPDGGFERAQEGALSVGGAASFVPFFRQFVCPPSGGVLPPRTRR